MDASKNVIAVEYIWLGGCNELRSKTKIIVSNNSLKLSMHTSMEL